MFLTNRKNYAAQTCMTVGQIQLFISYLVEISMATPIANYHSEIVPKISRKSCKCKVAILFHSTTGGPANYIICKCKSVGNFLEKDFSSNFQMKFQMKLGKLVSTIWSQHKFFGIRRGVGFEPTTSHLL